MKIKIKAENSRGKSRVRMMTLLVAIFIAVSPLWAMAQTAKVSIKEQGFYRVTKSQLAAVFSISEAQVVTTPMHVLNLGSEVTSVRDGGDVIFFGHGFNSRYTDQNVYFIKLGQPADLPIQNVTAGSTPYADSFLFTKRIEQQLLIRAELIKDPNFIDEDPILWRMLTSGLSTRFYNAPVSLDAVKPGTGGSVTVRLKGATEASGRYYHRARIDVNGQTVGFIDFEGLESKEATFTVPSGAWVSGNNTVRIESTPPVGTTLDSFYLDYIVANYHRTYAAVSDRVIASAAPSSVLLTGFSNSNIRVWNVTDRSLVKVLNGQQIIQNGSTWNVSFVSSTGAVYAACRFGAELAPISVVPGSQVDLKSTTWNVDHLTVSHSSLKQAAEEITLYRQSNGLDSQIITIEDVYDNFNFGIRDARALNNFLSYAYRNWNRSPRYVLLVGDGSLDYKNELGFNDSLIPAFPVIVQGGLYASDYPFGDPTGTGRVEMAVGRLPVKTTAEVVSYKQKMINYEMGGNWRTNAMISTDQSDFAGNFYGDGNDLQQSIIEREVARADIDLIGAQATRDKLLSGLNSGKEMSLYIGHGTANQLSQQSILLTSDTVTLTNEVSPTAFIMLGCLVGTFGGPGFSSLGEGLMLAKGGSVSLTAAATLISAADGKIVSEQMLNGIYTDGDARIGDAWMKGKNKLMYFGLYPAYMGFQLLGDPALAVGDAEAPRPDSGNHASQGSYEEWKSWYLPPALQEVGYEFNPEDDNDGDQFSNWSEYVAGTDPTDHQSLLEVVNIKRLSNGQTQVAWPSSTGRIYDLEGALNINGPYSLVATNINATTPINIQDFIDGAATLRYFRVVVK